MTKSYYVEIPIAGFLTVVVAADDEDAAAAKALEDADYRIECEGGTECGELECYSTLVEGNVFFGPLDRISVQEGD